MTDEEQRDAKYWRELYDARVADNCRLASERDEAQKMMNRYGTRLIEAAAITKKTREWLDEARRAAGIENVTQGLAEWCEQSHARIAKLEAALEKIAQCQATECFGDRGGDAGLICDYADGVLEGK